MRIKKNQHRYYIVIVSSGKWWLPNQRQIIYIGAVTKDEMPYGGTRSVSSTGELLYSYSDYRNTLLFRKGAFRALSESELPPERIKADPDDTVIAYDMKKVNLKKRKPEDKLLDMFYKGETEWFGIKEERDKKINQILQ